TPGLDPASTGFVLVEGRVRPAHGHQGNASASVDCGLAVRHVVLREAAEGGFVTAVTEPFPMMLHAEPVIKLARRVPVEHMKIDAAPAALDRDRGEPRHEALADAFSARGLADVEVF